MVVFALDALISLGTGEILRVVSTVAIDGESAEWVVFLDAKLPSVAQTFLGALTQRFVGEPFRRNNTIALRALGGLMAGMGPAFVIGAEVVFGTRNLTVRVAIRRCIASQIAKSVIETPATSATTRAVFFGEAAA